MAEKTSRGIPVAVAVASDGRKGWYSPSPRPEPDQIAEIRHHEWHRALDVLGVPRTDRFEFGYPDGELTEYESELADRVGDLVRNMRPSQIYVTQPGDPHPDHRTLARTVRRVVAEIYDSRTGGLQVGPPPQVFAYRVYPGEGFWSEGRPPRMTVRAVLGQFLRSLLGLRGRRALLVRASGSKTIKRTAIDAYKSQRRLLNGELRYVWESTVELYWTMDVNDLSDAQRNCR